MEKEKKINKTKKINKPKPKPLFTNIIDDIKKFSDISTDILETKKEYNIVTEIPLISKDLICFSLSHNNNNNKMTKSTMLRYENSDKIILPVNFLQIVSNSEKYVHFRLSKRDNNSMEVYVGTREYNAPDNTCYVPLWIMDYLNLKEGDKIILDSVYLPDAKKIKAKIPKVIKNYKPVLEYALRHHTALFMGKILRITMLNKTFDIIITELEPDHAVSIINCDPAIDVEFY